MDKKTKEIWEKYKQRGSTKTASTRTLEVTPKMAKAVKEGVKSGKIMDKRPHKPSGKKWSADDLKKL